MSRLYIIVSVLFVLISTMSCSVEVKKTDKGLRATLQDELSNNGVLRAWLNCEECQEGQLEQVLKLGDDIVPQLGQVLDLSTKYLASDSLEDLEAFQLKYAAQVARDSYAVLSDMNPRFKKQVREEQFVDAQLRRLLLRYQARAALSLELMGTARSKAALAGTQSGKNRP